MSTIQQTIAKGNREQVSTTDDRTEQILADFSAKQGLIPRPLKIMAKRSGVVEAFMSYRSQILEAGPLSQREQALVGLAATVTLKSANCIPMWANHARKAGISEEEIVQTLLIVSMISGMPPLQIAYGSLEEKGSE